MAARHVCLLFRRFTQWGADVTRPYVEALEARGIPHLLVGGKSFHEREEVESLRTALAAIEWPDDELSVYATLRGPLFAIGDEALLEYRERVARAAPVPRAAERTPDRARSRRTWPRGGRRSGCSASCTAGATCRPVEETIAALLAATRAHAAFILRPSGEQALANVLHIAELARGCEAAGGISFRGFVEQLADDDDGEAAGGAHRRGRQRGRAHHDGAPGQGARVPRRDPRRHRAPTSRRRIPSRYIDSERGLCAVRLAGWSPWDLLDHEEDELARDRAEGVRVAYVAATRARDLLVVPAVGDDPFANGWEFAAADGWLEPVQRAVYPDAGSAGARPRAGAGVPALRRRQRAPQRPDRDAPGRDNVQAGPPRVRRRGREGRTIRSSGGIRGALTLDVQPQYRHPPPGPDRGSRPRRCWSADRRAYSDWQRARTAAHRARAPSPAFAVRTVTEWARRAGEGDERARARGRR